nr:TPA_inf: conotoxin precursor Cerm08 [Conus judaeus]
MMLFMFAAIIFTMVSTTVSLGTCANEQKVCLAVHMGWKDELCDCPGILGGCIMEGHHEFSLYESLQFYTCQPVSDFRICHGSETAFDPANRQFNCRCESRKYILAANADVVCG